MQIERRELDVYVVFFLESFDLNEADIAPRSDEVRDYDDRGALGCHGKLVFVYICHAWYCTVQRAERPSSSSIWLQKPGA
jgi:hypothetical protein